MNKYKEVVWIKLIICLFFLSILTSGSCKSQNQKSEQILKKITDQVWIHSYEEDSGEVKAYRPQDFDFPPARGREGFLINADSSFISYRIAPTDGTQKEKGSWTLHDGMLKISFEEHKPEREVFLLDIISFENGLLKTKQIINQK